MVDAVNDSIKLMLLRVDGLSRERNITRGNEQIKCLLTNLKHFQIIAIELVD